MMFGAGYLLPHSLSFLLGKRRSQFFLEHLANRIDRFKIAIVLFVFNMTHVWYTARSAIAIWYRLSQSVRGRVFY